MLITSLKKTRYILYSFCSIALLAFLPFFSSAQNKIETYCKLTAVLKNAPFDTLYLLDYTDQNNTYFLGKKDSAYTWTFYIPDSTVHNMELAALVSSKFNKKNRTSTWIRFISEKHERIERKISNIGLEDRENYIYAIFRDRSIYEDNAAIKINGIDTIVKSIKVIESFYLENNDEESDINIRAEDPYFGWFLNTENIERTYDEYLDSYIKIAEKYPNSKFLITSLCSNLYNFETKEDVRKIFDILTTKHKSSKWGTRIANYLSEKFKNMDLTCGKKIVKEKIIEDSTKYNLIIFTASWCKPCIEEIPLLKRIYENVRDKVIFTYVSLDDERGMKKFEEIILRDQIPWRTLYALKELEEVKSRYVADVIPLNLLVAPNGFYQRVDVRKKDDEKRIYSEIGLNDIKQKQ